MSEHFKALMRQGRLATRPAREALQHVTEAAAAKDSIRCPNCSNTLGIQDGLLAEGVEDPLSMTFPPGLDVYVTTADPIIDGAQDVEENGGKVIVCWFCGYDVTEPVLTFYSQAKND